MDRLISGAFTSKNGFSVVAPIRVMIPASTAGRRASCWLLLNRCTSSRKRMVPLPISASRSRAPAITSRTSFTPAVTAESDTKARSVVDATTVARVVLPVPGGPQRMIEESRSASMRLRSGAPGPSRCCWPTISSRVRGRIRAASGAPRARRSCNAASNRSAEEPSSTGLRVGTHGRLSAGPAIREARAGGGWPHRQGRPGGVGCAGGVGVRAGPGVRAGRGVRALDPRRRRQV